MPVSEINYLNGKKRTGKSMIYYDNGKVQEESYYKNEIKTGLTKWFNKSGKRVAEYNYENGEFQGLQTTFYDSDTIQATTEYTNNVQNGEYKEYYRNGIVKLQGNYINGTKEGSWIEFDELGKAVKDHQIQEWHRQINFSSFYNFMRKIRNPFKGLEGYNCFGCSPDNSSGLQLSFVEEGDELVSVWSPKSYFQGYHNILHGGIQATLMDEIASWVVYVKLDASGFTSTMNVRYLKPVYVTDTMLTLRASIKELRKILQTSK